MSKSSSLLPAVASSARSLGIWGLGGGGLDLGGGASLAGASALLTAGRRPPETAWREGLAQLLVRVQTSSAAPPCRCACGFDKIVDSAEVVALRKSCAVLEELHAEDRLEVERLSREKAAFEAVALRCEAQAAVAAESAARAAEGARHLHQQLEPAVELQAESRLPQRLSQRRASSSPRFDASPADDGESFGLAMEIGGSSSSQKSPGSRALKTPNIDLGRARARHSGAIAAKAGAMASLSGASSICVQRLHGDYRLDSQPPSGDATTLQQCLRCGLEVAWDGTSDNYGSLTVTSVSRGGECSDGSVDDKFSKSLDIFISEAVSERVREIARAAESAAEVAILRASTSIAEADAEADVAIRRARTRAEAAYVAANRRKAAAAERCQVVEAQALASVAAAVTLASVSRGGEYSDGSVDGKRSKSLDSFISQAVSERVREIARAAETAAEVAILRASTSMAEADAEAEAAIRRAQTRAEAAEVAANRRIAAAAERCQVAEAKASSSVAAAEMEEEAASLHSLTEGIPTAFAQRISEIELRIGDIQSACRTNAVRAASSAGGAGDSLAFPGSEAVAAASAAVDASLALRDVRKVLECLESESRKVHDRPRCDISTSLSTRRSATRGQTVSGLLATRTLPAPRGALPRVASVITLLTTRLVTALDAVLNAWSLSLVASSPGQVAAEIVVEASVPREVVANQPTCFEDEAQAVNANSPTLGSQAKVVKAESMRPETVTDRPHAQVATAHPTRLRSDVQIPEPSSSAVRRALSITTVPSEWWAEDEESDVLEESAEEQNVPKLVSETSHKQKMLHNAKTEHSSAINMSGSTMAGSFLGERGRSLSRSPRSHHGVSSARSSYESSVCSSLLEALQCVGPPECELPLSIAEVQSAIALDRSRVEEERLTRHLQLCLRAAGGAGRQQRCRRPRRLSAGDFPSKSSAGVRRLPSADAHEETNLARAGPPYASLVAMRQARQEADQSGNHSVKPLCHRGTGGNAGNLWAGRPRPSSPIRALHWYGGRVAHQ